jgi:hypothetical protein
MAHGGYLRATQHPWSCVVFVLPLLLTYEAGLHVLGSGNAEILRNGADAWLRLGLANLGLEATFWAPALLVTVLVLWSLLRRRDRPEDFLGVWLGMTIESLAFAVGLWAISRGLWPLVEGLGLKLTGAHQQFFAGIVCRAVDASSKTPDPAVEQIVSFIGAGIYEETLFRLLLFSTMLSLFRLTELPGPLRAGAAATASALLFAAAHNLGPYGETFDGHIFFFRTLAGLYFTLLYHFRGFGIAVGAHTGYDVLVGVLVKNG